MQDIKDTVFALFEGGLLKITMDYNKGLVNFSNRLERLRKILGIDLYITVHQPDTSDKCGIRLWASEPHIGETGHPDTGDFTLIDEWFPPLVVDEFIKGINGITFIDQKGVGGNFASKGTALYKVN